MVFSILFLEKSSKWLDELREKMTNDKSIDLIPSTILALYIRRNYFVCYSTNTSASTLTFSDWIDLLLEGNFREQISITEWPKNFS